MSICHHQASQWAEPRRSQTRLLNKEVYTEPLLTSSFSINKDLTSCLGLSCPRWDAARQARSQPCLNCCLKCRSGRSSARSSGRSSARCSARRSSARRSSARRSVRSSGSTRCSSRICSVRCSSRSCSRSCSARCSSRSCSRSARCRSARRSARLCDRLCDLGLRDKNCWLYSRLLLYQRNQIQNSIVFMLIPVKSPPSTLMMATPVVLRPEDGVSGGPGKIVELGHPVLCCTPAVSILCYESILGGGLPD